MENINIFTKIRFFFFFSDFRNGKETGVDFAIYKSPENTGGGSFFFQGLKCRDDNLKTKLTDMRTENTKHINRSRLNFPPGESLTNINRF